MTDLDLAALYRLARAASDLGHYNLSKLLNVAAVSYVNRAAWSGSPLTTDRALAEAVAALEPQLRAAQLDQHLLSALQRARETVAAGQLVSYEEAPIIYVCRVCGAVVQTTPPEQCPYCGAGQLVFQPLNDLLTGGRLWCRTGYLQFVLLRGAVAVSTCDRLVLVFSHAFLYNSLASPVSRSGCRCHTSHRPGRSSARRRSERRR